MCPYWLDMCPCKKSLKVQEKSFQAFVCVYLNAIELKKERSFANLSHQTLIWPQCLSPMVFGVQCMDSEKQLCKMMLSLTSGQFVQKLKKISF